MIDPLLISTIRVGQLVDAPFNLTDKIPHEVGNDLRRGSVGDLATFIVGIIGTTGSLAFLPIAVTDNQTLPTTTTNEWFLAGKGTYHQTGGYPDIICTEELNAIVGNGTNWILAVEIPIVVDPPAAMISQYIREGVVNYSPSENTVYQAIKDLRPFQFIDYPLITVATQTFTIPAGTTAKQVIINEGIQYPTTANNTDRVNTFTQSGSVVTLNQTIEINNYVSIFYQ
jgi:hypothetical protein